jgi:hypothetical protein
VERDPFSLRNLAADPAFESTRKQLAERLDAYLQKAEDPRALGRGDVLEAVMRRFPVMGTNR